MSKRYSHIDVIEALAIFFVVLYHSTLYKFDFGAGTSSDAVIICYMRYFSRTILSTCVPLFFFANGYLLFAKTYSYEKHLSRIMRIIPIPLIGLLLRPIYAIIDGERIIIKTIVMSWLNLDIEKGMNSFWFIGALVCIYILFPALKSLYDNDTKSFYCLTMILFFLTFGIRFINIILVLANAPIKHIDYPMIDMFVPLRRFGYSFVYFCVGGIAVKNELKIISLNRIKRINSAVCLIVISCLVLFGTGIVYSGRIGGIWDIIWEGYDTIPTLISVIAIYILSLNVTKRYQILEIISQNTLWVYLFHGIII